MTSEPPTEYSRGVTVVVVIVAGSPRRGFIGLSSASPLPLSPISSVFFRSSVRRDGADCASCVSGPLSQSSMIARQPDHNLTEFWALGCG